ncbi:MAG: bifunctional aspartate kinase/homoserine dehydrogenase I [Phycisphaerae bacterium]|nr:bifunctional aspartate kinase/homoserine dehydrogenase I [Gemmatimonadaceae bacterium]
MAKRLRAPEVHKFGGASLADANAVRHALDIIATRMQRAVIVVSALAGVTDGLLTLANDALGGHRPQENGALAELRQRHREVAQKILHGAEPRLGTLAQIDQSFADLGVLLDGVTSLRELTARTQDLIVARGERLSAMIVVNGMLARGQRAQYVDGTEVIVTDGLHGGAFPDLAATDKLARARLRPLLAKGVIPVIPGFIGGTAMGTVATLGRGGSDLTATILGRSLGASSVSLWKDVPGLLTTDPRVVASARVIPQLNVREAAELAYYGAKVLHPRALIPLARRSLPVFIRPFGNPESQGTEISTRRTLSRYPVKAISMVPAQALVTVTGNGMLGVPGIAARTFSALHNANISVALISQASSEHSICLCVPTAGATRARAALHEAFAMEIARREIDGVDVQSGMSMIAVVGLGMAGAPGIAARVFRALATAKVNVVAIAQGSSELNISIVVSESEAHASVRVIHAEFQLDKIGGGGVADEGSADVVILGFGQIGRELARMLPGAKAKSKLNVVGVIDSSGYVFDPAGLSPRRLQALATTKAKGVTLAASAGGKTAHAEAAVEEMASHALSRPILVDLTADDTMIALRKGVAGGMDIVLANKRPLTDSRGNVELLRSEIAEQRVRLRQEATVGAGLPVMDTYAKLVESGDKVVRIEGCTSGTLGFLLTEIGRGVSFSAALRRAMEKGYSEPDPRDDLSGMDVARKALILARMLGYRGELGDVAVSSLVPAEAQRLPLAKYLASLESFDADWNSRQATAHAENKVLRYVLSVTPRKVSVGLQSVASSHPLASLRGTDNQIVFTTNRYRDNPLVITGPGAGPAVTAAGVLNDVLKLATT